MSDFDQDRIDDAYTILTKIGNVSRAPALSKLKDMAPHVYDAFDGEVLFDIYYDGGRDFKSITFTEIFSHGLLISPCNDDMRYSMTLHALSDDDPAVPAERILGWGRIDKYQLRKRLSRKPVPAAVFLPGTNLLSDKVNWAQVQAAVDEGALVKMHPITSAGWERRLKREFGSRLVSKGESGFDLLSAAERVYTTSNSEMGLLAILMDKPVNLVEAGVTSKRPIYRQLYEAVLPQDNPKAALEKVLGSRHAGFYWPWHDSSRPLEIVNAMRGFAHA